MWLRKLRQDARMYSKRSPNKHKTIGEQAQSNIVCDRPHVARGNNGAVETVVKQLHYRSHKQLLRLLDVGTGKIGTPKVHKFGRATEFPCCTDLV